jgi:type I restriction enzyme S subunit
MARTRRFVRDQSATGSKTDTGTILDALNVRNIPRLRFVRPPDPLLEAFEVLVRPVRSRMEQSAAETATLRSVRDALLPRLLSGELRPKDADRIVEAASA